MTEPENTLRQILHDKGNHVQEKMGAVPTEDMRKRAEDQPPARGFVKALQNHLNQNRYGLICEIKKASPSRGVIRENFDPVELAKAYEQGGASCLSVLTDMPYFQGHDDYLVAARSAVSLPVLRKDFMLIPWQIYESRALGADCVLLIMAALEDERAADMESIAEELGMDVLVEVHNDEEMHRALKLKSPLIGVNNRDLTTLQVDMATTEKLSALVPPDKILVSESGLSTRADLDRMAVCGARCFLIGESLMRQDDVADVVRKLLLTESK